MLVARGIVEGEEGDYSVQRMTSWWRNERGIPSFLCINCLAWCEGFIAFSLNSHKVNRNVSQVYWDFAEFAQAKQECRQTLKSFGGGEPIFCKVYLRTWSEASASTSIKSAVTNHPLVTRLYVLLSRIVEPQSKRKRFNYLTLNAHVYSYNLNSTRK